MLCLLTQHMTCVLTTCTQWHVVVTLLVPMLCYVVDVIVEKEIR